MKPGTTMFARMPNGPSSAASARTRPSSPVLAAVTAAVFGRPVRLDCPPIAMDAGVQHEVRSLGSERQRDGAADVAAAPVMSAILPLSFIRLRGVRCGCPPCASIDDRCLDELQEQLPIVAARRAGRVLGHEN